MLVPSALTEDGLLAVNTVVQASPREELAESLTQVMGCEGSLAPEIILQRITASW